MGSIILGTSLLTSRRSLSRGRVRMRALAMKVLDNSLVTGGSELPGVLYGGFTDDVVLMGHDGYGTFQLGGRIWSSAAGLSR